MLSDAQKRLYARHLLLPEIGQAGQERLCAARIALAADGEEPEHAAAAWCRTYLGRAGVQVDDTALSVAAVPGPAVVAALAGDPRLRHAASALSGAFAAVEAIKAVVGAGSQAALPRELALVPGKRDEGQP